MSGIVCEDEHRNIRSSSPRRKWLFRFLWRCVISNHALEAPSCDRNQSEIDLAQFSCS
jgi:hypothetical protein